MALTILERNRVIGIVAVVAIAVIAGAFFLGRGCSDDKAPTATATATTGTTAKAAVGILEQHATPDPATEGETINFIVRVSGDASSVSLIDERPPATGDGAFQEDFSLSMAKGKTLNNVTTWTASSPALQYTGRHRFHAVATAPDGALVPAAGDWPTYVVQPAGSAAGDAAASPQPAPSPSPAPVPQILSMTVSPDHTTLGSPITFTVTVQGEPATISMVYGAAGGDISTPHNTSVLLMESSGGGVTTWKTSVPAPKGFSAPPPDQGACFFTAVMVTKDGAEIKKESPTLFYVN